MGMSVAVAGKGGTGKTTVSAMIVSWLVKHGMGPVLAIDADPDANLGALLGLGPQHSVGELREEVLETFKNFPAGASRAQYVEAGLHGIIGEAKGFDLLTMGRGEGPGCYCYLNSLIRKFCDDLSPHYAWVVIDNEAGLEHVSRRTTGNIDALLIVVTDNPISLMTASRIDRITESIRNEFHSKYIVTNMVPENRRDAVMEKIRGMSVPYLCDFPLRRGMADRLFETGSLAGMEEPAFDETVRLIVEKINSSRKEETHESA